MKRFIGTRNFLFVLLLLAIPAASFAGIGISIRVAPPALPVYTQPPCPVDGYLWTPGYWAWGTAGYYWVPGAWVAPPHVGLLWTPGYWGFAGGSYLWHAGYWGPHVGFYGGINYGFGYPGHGFFGGVWNGRSFRYNTAVFNVNRTVIHNTYVDGSFVHNTVVNSRTSFSGPHGVNARPNANQRVAAADHHGPAMHNQVAHQAPHQNLRQPVAAAVNHEHAQAHTQRQAPQHQEHQLQARREVHNAPHAR